MRTLSNAGLIDLWERGAAEHPIDRALTLLSICTGEPADALATLSVGARDRKLMQVYEHLFGPALDAFGRCPVCDEPHEYTLSTHDLVTTPAYDDGNLIPLTSGEATFVIRLPNSLDLRAILSCADAELAGTTLAERCVVEAYIAGRATPSNELPRDFLEPISSALDAADPAAEVLIGLECIACSHQWQVALDIERFLWSKVAAASKRLLREVHDLASAYGWSEADILSLSPARRQIYTELAWAAS